MAPTISEGVEVKFPSTLKYLGDYAFNVGYLKSINLPDGLEYIGNRALGNMKKEISIEIPYTVHTIPSYAFVGNSKIKNISFKLDEYSNSRLKTIGANAFYNTGIQSLIIPASVENIGEKAFAHNSNLTKLTFEGALDGTSKLDTIGEMAFSNCNLTYESRDNPLIIPPNVREIGNYAFSDDGFDSGKNPKLNYIKYTGTNDLGTGWYSIYVKEIITTND